MEGLERSNTNVGQQRRGRREKDGDRGSMNGKGVEQESGTPSDKNTLTAITAPPHDDGVRFVRCAGVCKCACKAHNYYCPAESATSVPPVDVTPSPGAPIDCFMLACLASSM